MPHIPRAFGAMMKSCFLSLFAHVGHLGIQFILRFLPSHPSATPGTFRIQREERRGWRTSNEAHRTPAFSAQMQNPGNSQTLGPCEFM